MLQDVQNLDLASMTEYRMNCETGSVDGLAKHDKDNSIR